MCLLCWGSLFLSQMFVCLIEHFCGVFFFAFGCGVLLGVVFIFDVCYGIYGRSLDSVGFFVGMAISYKKKERFLFCVVFLWFVVLLFVFWVV